MSKFIVGFSKPKKWKLGSWLIRKAYKTDYSHVYIKMWSEKYSRYIVYQASHTLVNFMSTAIFEQEAIVIKEFQLQITDDSKTKIMQFAIDNAGKPYGFLNLLGLGIKRGCELLGLTGRNFLSDQKHSYVCSELIAQILKEFHSLGQEIKDSETITPKDIYEILVKNGQAQN